MKHFKDYVLMLPLLAATVPAQGQTVVLEESLKNVFSEAAISSDREILTDWSFENCHGVKEDGVVWVQVGSGGTPGSISTPQLSSLKGNVLVSSFVRTIDEGTTINYSTSSGNLTASKWTLAKNRTWYQLPLVLLRGGDKSTRIIFSSSGNDTSLNRRFYIANILVRDIGDALYYETFDKLTGEGGNDNDFGGRVRNTAGVNNLDYITSDLSSVSQGNSCIYLGASSSSYTTASIPKSSISSHVILKFRVAGVTGSNTGKLTITHHNEKNDDEDPFKKSYTPSKGAWGEEQLVINDFNFSKPIIFSGSYVFIDDVMVSELPPVSMSETLSNEEELQKYEGQTVNLTLQRTLQKDIWNTMCVPFEMTRAKLQDAFLHNSVKTVNIVINRFSGVNDGLFTFTTSATGNTDTPIPAGQPFLVKVDKDLVNPTFPGVTIEATAPGRLPAEGDYYLQGIFSPRALTTDGTNLFLGTDGYLYAPAVGTNTINGMRAYFVVPSSSQDARMKIIDDESAGISVAPIVVEDEGCAIYNLCGQAVGTTTATLPKGLYISKGKKFYIK